MQKKLIQTNCGYTVANVEGLLGIERGHVRYWRKKLDPLPERSRFSASILLAYRVIKTLVIDKNIAVRRIKNFDDIFKVCVDVSRQHKLDRLV